MWQQEVSALTGQCEGKTNSSDVCDWCCDWVSTGHDPPRGQTLKAKSLHDGCWEMFSCQRGRGRFKEPVSSVVCFKPYVSIYEEFARCIFLPKMVSGFNDSQPQRYLKKQSPHTSFVLYIYIFLTQKD